MIRDDGGPAFPVPYSNERDAPTMMPTAGMTLRDWFAGQALANIVVEWDTTAGELAVRAYQVADAMLKAREQQR